MQQPAIQSDLPAAFEALVLVTHAVNARHFSSLGCALLSIRAAIPAVRDPADYAQLCIACELLVERMGLASQMVRECELVFSQPVDVSVKKPPKREPSWAKRAPSQPPPINAEEVAYMALCSPKHVYDLCSQPGAIPHFRRGRRITFDRAEIQAWLDGFKVG